MGCRCDRHFNPRTREGCDVRFPSGIPTPEISIHAPVKGATVYVRPEPPRILISIHAPVKGATIGSSWSRMTIVHFNPRTREGCDPGTQRTRSAGSSFQSTHP